MIRPPDRSTLCWLGLTAALAMAGGGCQPTAVTREKDSVRLSGGVTVNGDDLCEQQGWYGDGECDEFCPRRDPDCPVPQLTRCPEEGCPAGQYCEPDEQVCAAHLGLPCTIDADCREGDVCSVDGLCYRADASPCVPGREDRCTLGLVCVSEGKCAAESPICRGRCVVEDPGDWECLGDGECGLGSICEVDPVQQKRRCLVGRRSCLGEADCRAGMTCRQGGCIPAGEPCNAEDPCEEGQVCVDSVGCYAPDCDSDRDCSEGQLCDTRSRCRTGSVHCVSERDCQTGQECQETVCVTVGDPVP